MQENDKLNLNQGKTECTDKPGRNQRGQNTKQGNTQVQVRGRKLMATQQRKTEGLKTRKTGKWPQHGATDESNETK